MHRIVSVYIYHKLGAPTKCVRWTMDVAQFNQRIEVFIIINNMQYTRHFFMSANSICVMYEPILEKDNGQWSANNHPVKKNSTKV